MKIGNCGTMVALSTASALTCAIGCIYFFYRKYKTCVMELEHERRKRSDERKGRTLLEKQLRKLQQQSTENSSENQGMQIIMQPIGYLSSVYNGRNGTPRQGVFVPNSRAVLRLEPRCNPRNSLDGLQEFSHIWLIFVFHENTNFAKQQQLLREQGVNNKNNIAVTKSKIKPPRLENRKVGLYATRSPHRHNNIGLTLARMDKIDENGVLYLSSIDLCDGTPILDIKPVIEYDCVQNLKVPEWIKDPIVSLQTFTTAFTENSLQQLQNIMENYKLKLFKPDEQKQVQNFIQQVIKYDMRSYHKKSTKQGLDDHSVHLDRLKIRFTITGNHATIENICYTEN